MRTLCLGLLLSGGLIIPSIFCTPELSLAGEQTQPQQSNPVSPWEASVGQQRADGAWTLDDVLSMESLGSPSISPDGSWVTYVVSHRDFKENINDSDLWVVPTDGGEPTRLTHGPHLDRSPQWSPDGAWVAFLSNRDGPTQVYGINPWGGEAWKVTDWGPGVGSFRFSPDGHHMALSASPEKVEAEEEFEKERGRPIVWDSAYASDWTHLWVASIEDGRAGQPSQISPADQFVQAFVWSPDSRMLAWSARPNPVLRTNRFADVYVAPARGGEIRRITEMEGGENPVAWVEGLGIIAAGSGQIVGTFNSQLWLVPTEGPGDPVSLTRDLDENAGYVAGSPDELLVEASYRTNRRLYRIPLSNGRPSGDPTVLSDDQRYYSSFSASDDLTGIAFMGETASEAPELFASNLRSFSPRRLTETNRDIEDLALGETRVVRWHSRADGEEIEGVLTLPVGYQQGDAVPLLLVIHGGPSGVSTVRFVGGSWAYPIPVFSALGYAVLQPNYRGSTAYGERFRGLNRGDISGRDWVDIDSGVDHLVSEGIADPDRLGIMGWSFGGHHTYWGITQTDRFKAASAGAGANDLISMYSQTDLPEFYHTYLGPPPWEDFELYEERSAYRFVDRVTTPLLIQVGEKDERVPAEQSIQFFEAVKSIGNVPVKLVIYPGQPHGVREPRLQRDLMLRNVEWFTQWIPGNR